MNEPIKCPVCDKVGIPDYRKDEVVCPCCSTDLSIYKMLTDSYGNHKHEVINNKKWKIATATLTAIVILSILSLVFVYKSKQQEILKKDIEFNEKVEVLNDSINNLTNQLNLVNQEIEVLKIQPSVKSEFIYIVQKNDSPCKISRKLYGTENRYKEIQAIITKPLQPGDTLKIK